MPGLSIPPVDNSFVQGFRKWLLGKVTSETARDYTSIIDKKQWPPSKRSHVKAWRNYVKYLFSIGQITWEQLQAYKMFLYMGKSASKLGQKKVSDEEIAEYLEVLRENSYYELGILLLGGSRLSHIVKMLNEYNPGEEVLQPHGEYEKRLYCSRDFCRYYMGILKGRKKCYYIYYPSPSPIHIHINNYRKTKDKLHKLGIEIGKFRDYTIQKLRILARENNIDKDAAELIVSHTLSVTGAHYLNTRDWADKLFSIYVKYLKEKGLI